MAGFLQLQHQDCTHYLIRVGVRDIFQFRKKPPSLGDVLSHRDVRRHLRHRVMVRDGWHRQIHGRMLS